MDSEILSNSLLAEALTELGHPTSLEQAVALRSMQVAATWVAGRLAHSEL